MIFVRNRLRPFFRQAGCPKEAAHMKRKHYSGLILNLIILLTGSLLLTGCQFLPREEEPLAPPLMQPATIEYRTRPVERGDLIEQVRMSGAFVPETQQALSFEKQGGRLKAIHVRIGELVEADQLLMELDSEQLETQIAMTRLDVERAEINLAQAKQSGDRYTVRRAEIDHEQQVMRLADMEKQLEATRIYAPFAGQVTYLSSALIGEYVNAYQLMVKVADLNRLVIVTTSSDANSLPIGATVDIEYDKKTIQAEVIANPGSLYNDPDENMRKAAIMHLPGDQIPEDVKAGVSVRITYVLQQRDDVLVVPRSYINLMSGRRYVNVLEDGIRVEKDVEIGLTTDTEAEIIKGLAEGDLVIIN
ncbi:MAG: efflux RND transporter periplasmic adaptor subunit [Clostridia bacterium]|nr:efflux RND transporter periplasmic adaptor subunit [Clostridia bacterium]